MKRVIPVLCGLLLLICSGVPAFAAESFGRTLERHLQAIQDRDLEAMMATVSEQPGPTLIFPNGQLLTGKQAFREFHTTWFADTQWRMDITEVRRVVSANMATVLLRYTYRDVPEVGQGNPRSSFLVLVFQQINDQWLLVHDQNTRIEPPADE